MYYFKTKQTVFSSVLATLIFATAFFVACSNQEEKNQVLLKRSDDLKHKMLSQDELFFEISEGLYDLTYFSNINNGEIYSELIVEYNKKYLFSIIYGFNTNEEHWKLKQDSKVVEKSSVLKANKIPEKYLTDVKNIIEKNIEYIYYQTIYTKELLLVSSINYHKSIINSVLRNYDSDQECDCTVHPGFLIDKFFFNCQEEHFYDISLLKNILDDYVSENFFVDSYTENLIYFLKDYTNKQIRFDDFYSFYISKKDFFLFVSNVLIVPFRGNCGWWCVLGCGSDHGCCGNYSGCCLYSHPVCFIHDKMCTNCKPSWFCLPGCKPDKKNVATHSSTNVY